MAKIVQEILDSYEDVAHNCYTVVVEYVENMSHRGWTNISYESKEQALRECFVGMVIRDW